MNPVEDKPVSQLLMGIINVGRPTIFQLWPNKNTSDLNKSNKKSVSLTR